MILQSGFNTPDFSGTVVLAILAVREQGKKSWGSFTVLSPSLSVIFYFLLL